MFRRAIAKAHRADTQWSRPRCEPWRPGAAPSSSAATGNARTPGEQFCSDSVLSMRAWSLFLQTGGSLTGG
jgi:hypothetical protein